MKLILEKQEHPKVNLVVDAPDWIPIYGLGTTIIGESVKGEKISGTVVGFTLSTYYDKHTGEVAKQVVYEVVDDKNEVMHDIMEDEITEYYPTTNELCAEYYEGEESEE